MKLFRFAPVVFFISLSLTACFYDNEEDLYQNVTPPACDTTNVTFASTVQPILDQFCTGCHRGVAASAGIRLDSHADVALYANAGLLLGVIRHEPAFSPMPKGGGKLSDCNIAKIEKWVAEGAQNN